MQYHYVGESEIDLTDKECFDLLRSNFENPITPGPGMNNNLIFNYMS
jgi:hypothetical protein